MSLIVPHSVFIRRHTVIPYLWRITCICGYKAYAASEEKALACRAQHIYDEEPFPDLDLTKEPH